MHLIESDPGLSGPTDEIPSAAGAGAGDWFVLIDGTSASAISRHAALQRGAGTRSAGIIGIYDLMWDLAKSDIAHA